MSATIVWIISTALFWFVVNIACNTIEANVRAFGTRVAAMATTGIAIGALASAIGYSFFALTILLVVQLWVVHRKVKIAANIGSGVALKYALPTFLLIISATAASYLFSMEACDLSGASCKRLFFERLYTPPHLKSIG
jgi:hypothetical protein